MQLYSKCISMASRWNSPRPLFILIINAYNFGAPGTFLKVLPTIINSVYIQKIRVSWLMRSWICVKLAWKDLLTSSGVSTACSRSHKYLSQNSEFLEQAQNIEQISVCDFRDSDHRAMFVGPYCIIAWVLFVKKSNDFLRIFFIRLSKLSLMKTYF